MPSWENSQNTRGLMFLENACTIHKSRYDYSKVFYINNTTPVTIICKEHGEFQQRPDNHLLGKGCRQCVKGAWYPRKDSDLQKRRGQSFFTRAKEVHNNFYDYSLSEYKNSHEKIRIICPIHGEFEQPPSRHLVSGCFQCGVIKSTQSCKHLPTLEKGLYGIWASMKARCLNTNTKKYPDYGGRGIKVDEEFLQFEPFMVYVKSLPDYEYRESQKLTLDRINVNGHYERGNLRWATYSTQGINTRSRKNNSGYRNIVPEGKRWSVVITRNRISKRIGAYNSILEAIEARNQYIQSIEEDITLFDN